MKKSITIVKNIIMLCLLVTVLNCAGKKQGPRYERVQVNPQLEVLLAEKRAANIFVIKGIDSYKQNNFEQAEWYFEEAIRVGPSFGPSYYWLTVIRFNSNDFDKALDLLEKSESLLKNNEGWMQKIDEMRKKIILSR